MGAALEEAISEHPVRLRRAIRQGRLDARRRLLGEKKLRAFADLFPQSFARSEHGALPASKQVQRLEDKGLSGRSEESCVRTSRGDRCATAWTRAPQP